MLLPRNWALGLGLLAATPGLSVAGLFDSKNPSPEKSEAAAQTTDNTNQQVAEDVKQALSKAKLVHRNVQIEVKAGTATISGEIKDVSQRALVTRIVSQVPGVKTVENQLQLMEAAPALAADASRGVQQAEFQGAAGRQAQQVSYDAQATTSNQAVAQAIAESLSTSGLSGYDIQIRYKSGVASLIGTVDDKSQVMRAEQAASQVPGVQQVLNRLEVQGRPVDIQQSGGFAQGPGYGPQQGYAPAPGYGPQQRMAYSPAPQGGPIQQTQGMVPAMPPQAVAPSPGLPQYGNVQPAGHHMYNQPNVPEYAWPSYAPYDNSAAISYPTQYDASAWPYIGPYYPYPQVPLDWRKSTLEWDDGNWSLKFDSRTDRWWWFLNPHNWH